jgi:hypothetical protein
LGSFDIFSFCVQRPSLYILRLEERLRLGLIGFVLGEHGRLYIS